MSQHCAAIIDQAFQKKIFSPLYKAKCLPYQNTKNSDSACARLCVGARTPESFRMCEVCIDPCVSGELSFEEKKGNGRKRMKRKRGETDRCRGRIERPREDEGDTQTHTSAEPHTQAHKENTHTHTHTHRCFDEIRLWPFVSVFVSF